MAIFNSKLLVYQRVAPITVAMYWQVELVELPSGPPDPELLDNLSAEHMKPGIHLIASGGSGWKDPERRKENSELVIRKIRII